MFKEPEFKNHYSYNIGTKKDKENSYLKKMFHHSTENKITLRREVAEEAKETYEEAKKVYQDLLKWESMEVDKIFAATGNVEEEIKSLQDIDPHVIFAQVNKARLNVQRVLDLYEDIYIVCHMTTVLKNEHKKLTEINKLIADKIEERERKMENEQKFSIGNEESPKEGEDKDNEREETSKRNLVETN